MSMRTGLNFCDRVYDARYRANPYILSTTVLSDDAESVMGKPFTELFVYSKLVYC